VSRLKFAGVETLGFVEVVGFHFVPSALTACDQKAERLLGIKNAIWQEELSCCSFKTHCGFEIVHASVMVIALGHPGFTQSEIECERGLEEARSRIPPESDSWLKIPSYGSHGIHVERSAHASGEIRGFKTYRFLEMLLCARELAGVFAFSV